MAYPPPPKCGTTIGRPLGLPNGSMKGMGGGIPPPSPGSIVIGDSSPTSLSMSIEISFLNVLVSDDVSSLNLKGIDSFSSNNKHNFHINPKQA